MDFTRLQQIADAFFAFFTTKYIIVYIVELILSFALFYYVIKVLVDNNAKKFIGTYFSLILLGAIVTVLADGISLTLFLEFLLLVSMFFLLMFSLEIKRSIWNMKKKEVPQKNFVDEGKTTAETEACIAAIIKALQNMSKRDTGALIVLSNGNLPKQIIDSGVQLNSDISSQLIEGIFFDKAPLHDGAMIIGGHKIKAAGCFLPLSQNGNLPKDLGTRHRAGIGITEVTDVISLIVSEETGIISIVKKGDITRYADYGMLRNILIDYYWSALDDNKKMKDKKEN